MDCSVCFEAFTPTGPNVPLVLACGHTLCKACVEHLLRAESKLRCAVCRKTSQLCSSSDLQTNHAILALTAVCTPENRQICQICKTSTAQRFCNDCSVDFCDNCFAQLHFAEAMQRHQTTDVPNKAFLRCPKHSKPFDAFCNTCTKPICALCCVDCSGHSFSSIADIATQHKSALEASVVELETLEENLTQKTQQTRQSVADANKSRDQLILQVQQAVQSIRLELDQFEKDMLERISTLCNASIKTCEIHQQHLETMHHCVQSLHDGARTLLNTQHTENANQVQLTTRANTHKTQLQSVCDQSKNLCNMPQQAVCPLVILDGETLEKSVQNVVAALKQSSAQLVWVENLPNIQWCKDSCVGAGGHCVKLAWQVESDDNSTTKRSCEVEIAIKDENRAVYRGADTTCLVQNLVCDNEYTFELRVVCKNGPVVLATCAPIRAKTLPISIKFVECSDGIQIENDGCRLTHVGNDRMDHFAFGEQLPVGIVSSWGVHIVNPRDWLFVGIISQKDDGQETYRSRTSFGWAAAGYEMVDGRKQQSGLDWQAGDTAIITLNSINHTLTLDHHRTNTTRQIAITPNLVWRLHACLFLSGSTVEVFSE